MRPRSTPLSFEKRHPEAREIGLNIEAMDSEAKSHVNHSLIAAEIDAMKAEVSVATHLCEYQRSTLKRSMAEIKRLLVAIEEEEETHRRTKKKLAEMEAQKDGLTT